MTPEQIISTVDEILIEEFELESDLVVLGPIPAYVARRGGRWRFHVVLRGRDPRAVLAGLVEQQHRGTAA